MASRLLAAALVTTLVLPAYADVTGTPRMIDGDTLKVAGQRIRLHEIDAPETAQTCQTKRGKPWKCGTAATQALRALVGRQTVTCKGDSRDRYGRLIAVCYVGRVDLNEQLVLQGVALAYRQYSMDYVRAEKAARSLREGLWRGKFVPPWEWRRGKRLSSTATPSPPVEAVK